MGFTGNRIYIILLIIFILVIGALIAIGGGSSGSSTQQRPDPKYEATINADNVGLYYILVTNENIPAKKILLPQDLPYTMNFAKDDILTFQVFTKKGYTFNSFDLDDGTYRSDNPLASKPNDDFEIYACIMPDNILPPLT